MAADQPRLDPEDDAVPTSSSSICCRCLPSFFSRRRRAGVEDDGQLTQPLNPQDVSAAAPGAADGQQGPSTVTAVVDELGERTRERTRRVLHEILATERAYVAALDVLVGKFLPLLDPLLDASSGEELLSAARALRGVHLELLQRLEQAGTADVSGVSRAFALMTPFLRMYSTYCSGYGRALARVTEARASTPALDELEAACGERIDSLLIRPVQRLCKYPLFFGELLGVLPGQCASRPDLERAADAVRRVNEEVNAKIRGAEDGSRLVALYHELGGKLPALLAPTRSLLLELDVKLSRALSQARAPRSRRRSRLVLLSDSLVVAKVRRPPALRRVSLTGPRRRERAFSSGSDAPASPASGASQPILRLKAVLPLRSVRLSLAPSRPSRRRGARSATAKGTEVADVPIGSASAAGAIVILECPQPSVMYACKCTDAIAPVSAACMRSRLGSYLTGKQSRHVVR